MKSGAESTVSTESESRRKAESSDEVQGERNRDAGNCGEGKQERDGVESPGTGKRRDRLRGRGGAWQGEEEMRHRGRRNASPER